MSFDRSGILKISDIKKGPGMFGGLKNLANIMADIAEGMNVPGLQDAIAKMGMGQIA